MADLPWQTRNSSATLKGHAESKETATAKAQSKSWIPASAGMTTYFEIPLFFAFIFCCSLLLLAHSAIYRTAQADQGKSAMDGGFSFDKQGRASKRP